MRLVRSGLTALPWGWSLLLLAGCGQSGYTAGSTAPPPPVYTGLSFAGTVMAGTKAVSGSSVQLFAAGNSGNGSQAAGLLATPALTASNGSFTIPAAYNCPAGSSLLYLVASGGAVGTVGTVGNANNSNLRLLTALGPCSSVSSGMQVVVNEVTTVAGGYALAPFYTSATAIGASSTNQTGLTNAFLTAATLANPLTGTAPGATLPANAEATVNTGNPGITVSVQQRINSVANLLNACTSSAAGCATLYNSLGTSATNTLDALEALAHHPANGTAALYALASANAVFAPALSTAPADYTMFLTLGGGGLTQPTSLGVDSGGNIWVANYPGSVSRFTPAGAPALANAITGAGLNESYGLAVDANDNAWVTSEPVGGNGGAVSEFSTAGMALSGAGGYTQGGLDYPVSVAIDTTGTVWVTNNSAFSVTLLNASGMPLSGASGYQSPDLMFPIVTALDGNHSGWVANQFSQTVVKIAANGSSFTSYACCNEPAGIAIDQGNNVWIANYAGNSVSLISNTGAIVSNGAYTGLGAIYHPTGVVVDGNGSVWLANYISPTVLVELAGTNTTSPGASLSPAQGLGADAQLLQPFALAIDASGDLWVSNRGSNTLTKFIGLVSPVKTPLAGLPKAP